MVKMILEQGALNKYPYIKHINCKAEGFNLQSNNSTDLIWNIESGLECAINGEQQVIPSNSIILLDEGDHFTYEKKGLSQIKVLKFNSDVFSNSIIFLCGFINASRNKDLKKSMVFLFKDDQIELIESLFQDIEKMLKETVSTDMKRLIHSICDLLNETLAEKFTNEDKYVNGFAIKLNSQFNLFHNVCDYALQLNIKPKSLLRLFQKQGLKNPSEIIKDKLLLEIKNRIIYTNKSIREICFEMGFSDPAYFSRFFKRHVGVTAQHYRMQYRNGN